MRRAADLFHQRHDIQALLRSGFGTMHASRHWLLTVRDAALARAWIAGLSRSGLVLSAGEIGSGRTQARPAPALRAEARSTGDTLKEEAVSIAFSHEGLRAFGLQESTEFPFPTPFRSGMGSAVRKRLLGDEGQENWRWGDVADDDAGAVPGRQLVHVLVMQFWARNHTPSMPGPVGPATGFDGWSVEGCPSFFDAAPTAGESRGYEPFGFRDGVSQPRIDGWDGSGPRWPGARPAEVDVLSLDHHIAPGEFILGHPNEYGELSVCPDVELHPSRAAGADMPQDRFGFNGSYLAVRQIVQHVEQFRRLHDMTNAAPFRPPDDAPLPTAASTTAPSLPACSPSMAERVMGRRCDTAATPLVQRGPRPLSAAATDEEANAFRYRVDDANGFQCPRGAHIRRANPRDMLAHDVESGINASKLHRLLRRGRTYRVEPAACAGRNGADHEPCGSPAYRDRCGAGLMFVACNADLDRQFEFVQQRWMRNPGFADLVDEDDPLLGAASPVRSFSVPGLPLGKRLSLQHYTTTIGGGYFFLPGLRALSAIAGLPAPQPARSGNP